MVPVDTSWVALELPGERKVQETRVQVRLTVHPTHCVTLGKPSLSSLGLSESCTIDGMEINHLYTQCPMMQSEAPSSGQAGAAVPERAHKVQTQPGPPHPGAVPMAVLTPLLSGWI